MNHESLISSFHGYAFNNPAKFPGDVHRLRYGTLEIELKTITIDCDQSSVYGGPNKKVPGTDEFVEAAKQYGQTLPAWNGSILLQTSDGVPILWFIKGGMTHYVPQGLQLAQVSVEQIRKLIAAFEPPRNFGRDPRHDKRIQEWKDHWEAKGCKHGVYHFYYHIPQGQPKEKLMPYSDMKHPAAKDYLQHTKWEHHAAALWLKALDPQNYKGYNDRFLELRNNVEDLDVGDQSCFLSKTVIINAIVQPHKDKDEVEKGLVLTFAHGNFTGGDQIYLDIGMRFHQESGDLLVAPAQRLTHMGLDIESGERFSHAFSMRQNVYKDPEHHYFCDECDKGYAAPHGLMEHKRMIHPKDAEGNPIDHPRFYCRVEGCSKNFAAPATLGDHYRRLHPGLRPPKKYEDKIRPPENTSEK